MCLPSGKEHQKHAVHLKREEEKAPTSSSRYNHIWFDFSCVNICNFSYMITPFFTIEVCPLTWMKLTSSYTIERCYFLLCRLSFLVLLFKISRIKSGQSCGWHRSEVRGVKRKQRDERASQRTFLLSTRSSRNKLTFPWYLKVRMNLRKKLLQIKSTSLG